jgi:protein SCO1/2
MIAIRTLRIIRWTALALIVQLASGIAFLKFGPTSNPQRQASATDAAAGPVAIPEGVSIGGPFKLIDGKDLAVKDADYRGRWMQVFFGYTNVDPRIVALTGSDEQMAAVAKAYRVYYAPAEHEPSGADLVSHSTFLYMIAPSGKLDTLFPQDIGDDQLTATLCARLSSQKHPARPSRNAGLDTMMGNTGGMMWGMSLFWLLVIGVLVLAGAALVKYLFFRDYSSVGN